MSFRVPRMTAVLFVTYSLLSTSIAEAQENPLWLPDLSVVDTSANALRFPAGRQVWEGYHRKLDKLLLEGTGQVHIAHFGGSHLQADMWSMELRSRLQQAVPGVRGGRGFIFPYAMAKTNNPYWYLPEYTGKWTAHKNLERIDDAPLGIAGYTVTTTDTLTTLKVSFRGEVYAGYQFNRVKVFHRMDSSYAVTAYSKDPAVHIEGTEEPDKGYTEFQYDRYVDTLYLRFQRTAADQLGFTLRGITLESDDPGFFYHANGVNGASTTSWLRCHYFADELAVIKPDLVVFSIGINDAHDPDFSAERYKRNYSELIARVRAAAPDAAILLTTNTDSYVKRRYPNKNGAAVRDVMMQLAEEQGCAVWDTFGVMGGMHGIVRWEKAGLAKKDLVHMTRPGYTALGDLLFSALMEAYGEHLRTAGR
ncbi:MAG: GDSL-type esterase/lipase family protein [Flavobacteriales bacterium]